MSQDLFKLISATIRKERLYADVDLMREDIVKRFGIGRHRLNDLLTDYADGMSFPQFINAIRMEEAYALLTDYPEMTIAEIARQVSNITNALALAPTSAALVAKLTELERQLTEVETAIAKESIITPALTKDQIIYFFERQRKGDVDSPEFRSTIIDTFMQSAYLYDDHIVINLNYSGTKTPISKALIDDLESDPSSSSVSAVRFSPVKSRLCGQTRTLPVLLVTLSLAA